MSALQIVGLVIAGYALVGYVRLWISLITVREHRPKVNQVLVVKIMLAGSIGTNMLVWHMIPWWMALVIHCGVAIVVIIPALIFRAR